MSESGSIEGDGIGQAAAQRSSRNRFAVAGGIWFGGVVGVGCIVASALTSSIADRKIAESPLAELGVGVVIRSWAGDAFLKRLSVLWWIGTKSAFELSSDGVVCGESESVELSLKTARIFESAP